MVIGCNYNETMVHRNQQFDLCFTMFDARHFSGSAIILFESSIIGRVLHTGDFRFDDQSTISAMMPYLATSRIDHLVVGHFWISNAIRYQTTIIAVVRRNLLFFILPRVSIKI
jgi:Cft2 family RNA processing exonuclease